MKTFSSYNDKTLIANNTLRKDNLEQDMKKNILRKINKNILNFDNRQEYEVL